MLKTKKVNGTIGTIYHTQNTNTKPVNQAEKGTYMHLLLKKK